MKQIINSRIGALNTMRSHNSLPMGSLAGRVVLEEAVRMTVFWAHAPSDARSPKNTGQLGAMT